MRPIAEFRADLERFAADAASHGDDLSVNMRNESAAYRGALSRIVMSLREIHAAINAAT